MDAPDIKNVRQYLKCDDFCPWCEKEGVLTTGTVQTDVSIAWQTAECENCGMAQNESDLRTVWPGIGDITKHVEPGMTVPSGKFRGCGNLAYPTQEPDSQVQYAFDIQIQTVARVIAGSEAEAREKLDSILDVDLGWKDPNLGDFLILTEASIIPEYRPQLFEIGGVEFEVSGDESEKA